MAENGSGNMNGIPDCVKLEKRQIDRLKRWIKTLSKKQLRAAFEEDCSCASPLTWKIYATGLGDVIKVKFGDKELDLSIGDDNELLNP